MARFVIRPHSLGPDMILDTTSDDLEYAAQAFCANVHLLVDFEYKTSESGVDYADFRIGTNRKFHIFRESDLEK